MCKDVPLHLKLSVIASRIIFQEAWSKNTCVNVDDSPVANSYQSTHHFCQPLTQSMCKDTKDVEVEVKWNTYILALASELTLDNFNQIWSNHHHSKYNLLTQQLRSQVDCYHCIIPNAHMSMNCSQLRNKNSWQTKWVEIMSNSLHQIKKLQQPWVSKIWRQ